MRMPFLFVVYLPESADLPYYKVVVADTDLFQPEVSWMMDPDLPEAYTYAPSIDLEVESRIFRGENAETEALQFMKSWWANYGGSNGSLYCPPGCQGCNCHMSR